MTDFLYGMITGILIILAIYIGWIIGGTKCQNG